MSAKGYCTAGDVAAYLGITLTATQQTEAGLLIAAAEKWIDQAKGVAWLETGPIVEDVYVRNSPLVRVKKPPVLSISEVKVRLWWNSVSQVLSAGVDYELRDPVQGLLYIPFRWRPYKLPDQAGLGPDKLTITYMPTADPVPDQVRLAASVLASFWLQTSIHHGVDPNLIRRYQVGCELMVEYWDRMRGSAIPSLVYELLDNALPGTRSWVVV